MKLVCIDDGAVAELISGRAFQSLDFTVANDLLSAMRDGVTLIAQLGKIVVTQDKDALFLSTIGPWKAKKYLVIDCETSRLFTSLDKKQTLNSLQKLLRFCARFWSNGNFTRSEHIVPDSSKAVIFPLGLSDGGIGTGFRIFVEREPDKKRIEARDMDGRFLLAYKTSNRSEDSISHEVDYKILRKCFENLPNVYSGLQEKIDFIKKHSSKSGLAETLLSEVNANYSHLSFDEWIPLLTGKQRGFVFSDKDKAHRLLGPAGTGKTLALILKTLRLLKECEAKEIQCRALLVTHSEATRISIKETLNGLSADGFHDRGDESAVMLSVETLASLCAKTLKTDIRESEFIDRDAKDSKAMQLLYIEEAITSVKSKSLKTYSPLLSEKFREFINERNDEVLAPLFQHEISVLIKGRADDQFDEYKKMGSLRYGLPVENEADKSFVFQVFTTYQEQLESANKFDTDDVVISAVGGLHTPIWRRRRVKSGFDFIAIDETHLFNINELHLFHHFTRSVGAYPISYSIDLAQSVGDRGWSESDGISSLFQAPPEEVSKNTELTASFRSSPQIVSFCTSILASGASLFTDFQNSLINSDSAFTIEEERRSIPIIYKEFSDDKAMVEASFTEARDVMSSVDTKPWKILITSLSEELIEEVAQLANEKNKPVTILDKRGDFSTIDRARKSGHFVVGHADYVGGLEFDGVIVIGLDKGRVPLEVKAKSSASTNFMTYSAHNRLYVAASRARYGLRLLGNQGRGPSDLLSAAKAQGLIVNE